MHCCRAYREYEQAYGKPYQSPCESNKRTSITLQCLRRLGLLLSKQNKQLCHKRGLLGLETSGIHGRGRTKLAHIIYDFVHSGVHKCSKQRGHK